MSIGNGGTAVKILENKSILIFNYGGYNLNIEQYRNEGKIYDGQIIIRKAALVEPEIHEKQKKMPSGKRKLVTKRILVEVPYEELFEKQMIEVKNCSNCWQTMQGGMDYVALRLIWKIFDQYQEKGTIEDTISYDV